ncbi:MAG: hypothetical protein NTW62_01435 [Candidatus Nomurabacteria bacterium]|nr:hypothetical protein [Candidatus Nomurabacteria bacterium]
MSGTSTNTTKIEVTNLKSFKEKIKEIVLSEEAQKHFGKQNLKRPRISIGRYDCMGECILDWKKLSQLPKNYLEETSSKNCDFCISIN